MPQETQDLTPSGASLDDLLAQVVAADESGQPVDRQALLAAHPRHAAELAEFLANREQMQRMAAPLLSPAESARGPSNGHSLGKIRYFGDYELLEEIAAGGMGIVYKARQVSLNRIVAVKMILKGTLATDDDVKRFRAEAEAAANLQHPGIVAIHEIGLHEGQHYFSMDFVEGRSLADLPRERPIVARLAAKYVHEAAEAVHYAHEQGTLHRDLKPSNILIDRQGRVRITDFGLAKRITGNSDLTLTGQILGTPSYMPPEQALAKHGNIGTASDVYSLGAVLYELLAGRPPFRGESPAETLLQVETLDPVSPQLLNPATPRDLETICLKCLEKEPRKRYATAQLLADDLGRFLRHEPILARPISRPARAWRWCRRNPVVASLSAAVCLLLVFSTCASTAGWIWAREAEQSQAKARALEDANQLERALKQSESAHPNFAQAERLLTMAIGPWGEGRSWDATLYRERARIRFERGKLRESIHDAEMAIRLAPETSQAASLLIVEAALEMNKRNWSSAQRDYLAKTNPDSIEAQVAAALLDPLNPRSLEQLSAAVEEDPQHPKLRYHRAAVAYQLTLYRTSKRHYDLAVADLERLISIRPDDRRVRQLLCSLLVQFHFLANEDARPLPRAKELLDHWLVWEPDALAPQVLTIRWHLERDQAAQALELCRRARRKHVTRPELALLEAEALTRLKEYREADVAYESLDLLLDEELPTVLPVTRALWATGKARLALELRVPYSAQSLLEAEDSRQPSNYSYDEWNELVAAWQRVATVGASGRAVTLCERWREIAPESPGPDAALGLHAGGGGWDPLVRFNSALKLAPSLRKVRFARGKWLETVRAAYPDALADFEYFAAYFPEDAAGVHELARFLLECPELSLRNVPRARDLARQVVTAEPRRFVTWELLARAEAQLGRHDEALRAIDTAVRLNRSEAHLLLRGDMLVSLRKFPAALTAYNAALQMNPQSDSKRLASYALRLAVPAHRDWHLYQRALELACEAQAKGKAELAANRTPVATATLNAAHGIALCRDDKWQGALVVLPQDTMREAFFRVMALAQLGQHAEAWSLYQTWSKRAAVDLILLDPAQKELAAVRREAAGLLGIALHAEVVQADLAARSVGPRDWPQWGGWGGRNNVALSAEGPIDWNPGEFDRNTGNWLSEKSYNVKWVTPLGSQTYGNPVVANGRVFVGTNNSHGYLRRYPADVDLGVLLCLNEADGSFLWQLSSPKLPTGRVHDWPLMGICSAPLAEGDRLWVVTNRGELLCLDAEGFRDGEDDGPVMSEPAQLFLLRRADDPAQDKIDGYIRELDDGRLPADLRARMESAGMKLPVGEISLAADDRIKAPLKKWTFQAQVNGANREFFIELRGPTLSGLKIITPDDKEEADVVWRLDMMRELGISQHNMCTCAPTAWGDILFICTSNGVDEAHTSIPAPDAPSFLALDKHTGKIHWTDNLPGKNIQHGQWSAPAVGMLGGVPQVIFGGGDGWVYSFHATEWHDGKPQLLWMFDINPKDSILELGGRGTRNEPFAMPVIYDGLVYVTTGQDPEHGEGQGAIWCINPTRRGDISPQLAVHVSDRTKPIPHKRIQAVVATEGELAVDNPNSGVVWHYDRRDSNGDGTFGFEECFHRTISSVVAQNDVLFAADFSGLTHCLNAKTGELYWTYDCLAAIWGTPLAVGDRVYVGDEDGDLAIFRLHPEPHQIVRQAPPGGPAFLNPDPLREIYHPSSFYTAPILANGTLYLATKDHLFAIADPAVSGLPTRPPEKSSP